MDVGSGAGGEIAVSGFLNSTCFSTCGDTHKGCIVVIGSELCVWSNRDAMQNLVDVLPIAPELSSIHVLENVRS